MLSLKISKIRYLFLFFLLASACRESIVHNLSETDANRFSNYLHQSGINSEKLKQADGKWSLAVDRNKTAEAINLLDQNRALRNIQTSAPTETGMFASLAEKNFNLAQILAGEIEATLAAIKGVLEVHVHIYRLAQENPWDKGHNKSKDESAAVLLITNTDFSAAIEDLQRLVAGASGINATDIAIVINPVKEKLVKSEVIKNSALIPKDSYQRYYFVLGLVLLIIIVLRKRAANIIKIKKSLLLREGESCAN